MSGSRPKRGLADFLSRELKAPPPAVTEPEVRQSDTSEVREKTSPKAHETPAQAHEPKAAAPAVKAVEPKAVEPRANEPKAAEPKAHESKVVEPKAHESKAQERPVLPVVSEPVAHAATASTPKVYAPVVSETREEPEETAPATELAESRTTRVSKSRTAEVRETVQAERSEPLYLRLTRKDVRFRDEQLGALHALARRLSKARRGARGERITDNTLVRVAVDLLLQHADELSGTDEAALLESLRKLSRKRG